jgi:ketosteroid isomerase-like protein
MPHTTACAAIALSLLLFFVNPSIAQDFSPRQNEVWQMEETYWKDLQTANYTHYMTLWHEDFLGWPYFSPHPVNKDGIANSLPTSMSDVLSYEFLEKAVRVTGEVGITQYAVKYTHTTPNGQTETRVSRITHTWLKTKNTWQIIGGMSSLDSSSAPPSSPTTAPSSPPASPASPPASRPK